jgi:hypothetical protein
MNTDHTRGQRLVVGALLVLCVVGGVILWVKHHRLTGQPSQATPSADALARTQLDTALSSLTNLAGAADAGKQFAELRDRLSKLPPDKASAAIRDFLARGGDAPTRLGFAVGPDGFLNAAPSSRVFLLDQLARLDRAAAAECAKQILARMDSPDEWAVCLRNLAIADASPETRAFLREKLLQLLGHEPWQKEPSVGYLEAFDVAVHLGGTNLLPALSGLACKKDNPAVAHAAYLALDRLAIQEPASALGFLQANPGLLAGRELMRADYFARLDARDPAQRAVLESYLLSPQLGAAELNQFAGVYPNANFKISNNLLTRSQTPNYGTLKERDTEALRLTQEWLADPRFAGLKPQLAKIKGRIETFVKQAGP